LKFARSFVSQAKFDATQFYWITDKEHFKTLQQITQPTMSL